MLKYYIQLIEQFKSATGVKNVDLNSEMFLKEFDEWIKNNDLIGKDYKKFLKVIEALPEDDSEYIEIGKGVLDSIVLDTKTPIITPYSMGMEEYPNTVIKANFMVKELPIVYRNKNEMTEMGIISDTSRRIITQNPYTLENISNWEQLHNNGYDICVGVYGNIYDKDRDKKIEQLKELRDSLTDYYNVDYLNSNDKYLYAIFSERTLKLFETNEQIDEQFTEKQVQKKWKNKGNICC